MLDALDIVCRRREDVWMVLVTVEKTHESVFWL